MVTNLEDLFSDDDKEMISKQGKVVIIDTHNLIYRTLFSAIFTDPDDNDKFEFWKHIFMNSIFSIIHEYKPEKVIMAIDSKNSWRYDHYALYKANRKDDRDKSVINFEKFYPVLNSFKQDIKETFSNIFMIECNRTEADDIIAVLTQKIFNNKQVVIISSDKDMVQLSEKNVTIYDAMNKKIINSINAKKDLELKIITGDKSDMIPAIKKGVGIKTAEKILNNGLESFILEEEANGNVTIRTNYERNKILIDFKNIPDEIETNIINTYNNYQITEINKNKLLSFFMKNKLSKLMASWENFSDSVKSLK